MTRQLKLVAVQAGATTFHFQTVGDGWRSWAICTVNDATGELLITSDWGNWSQRWNVQHLGAPSLTAFIGARGAVDYIASKLQGRHGQRFSAAKTVAGFRRLLCERRREVGHRSDHHLSRELAREIRDALGEVADDVGSSEDLFLSRVYDVPGFTEHISETPYESLEYEQTPEDRALRDLILLALIAACASRAANQQPQGASQ